MVGGDLIKSHARMASRQDEWSGEAGGAARHRYLDFRLASCADMGGRGGAGRLVAYRAACLEVCAEADACGPRVPGIDDRRVAAQCPAFRHGDKPIDSFVGVRRGIMQNMEHRAYKYRFYPIDDPARERVRTFGRVRCVYNGAHALRTEAWCDRQERIDYAEPDRLLVRRKKEVEKSWLAEVSCVPRQKTLRHCNAAFVNFFAGRAPNLRLHRKHDLPSVTYCIGGFRWKDGALTPAKMDRPLDLRWTRPTGAEPTSITVSKDRAGCSFVSFTTEEEIASLPIVHATLGIDLGVLNTAVMSTGEKMGNERFFRRDEKCLAKAQRRLARMQNGACHREKARWHAPMPAWQIGGAISRTTSRHASAREPGGQRRTLEREGHAGPSDACKEDRRRGVGRLTAAIRIQGAVVRSYLHPDRPLLSQQQPVSRL